jgi:hypothetical protein
MDDRYEWNSHVRYTVKCKSCGYVWSLQFLSEHNDECPVCKLRLKQQEEVMAHTTDFVSGSFHRIKDTDFTGGGEVMDEKMTLQEAIQIATPIIQSLVDDDIHFGDDDSECFSVILSAAEKVEEYRKKAEKWDSMCWWHNLSAEDLKPILLRMQGGTHTDDDIIREYRKAKEGEK